MVHPTFQPKPAHAAAGRKPSSGFEFVRASHGSSAVDRVSGPPRRPGVIEYSAQRLRLAAVLAALSVLGAGCGNLSDANGCNCLPLTLPDGSQTCACPGAGVASLSDSEWEVGAVQPSGQPARLFQLAFGKRGAPAMAELLTGPIDLPDPLGSLPTTLQIDGRKHATGVPFLDYSAITYGAETADQSALAFAASAKLDFLGRTIVKADAIIDGWWSGNRDESITGTASFSVDLDLGFGLPPESMEGEVGFNADLIPAQ